MSNENKRDQRQPDECLAEAIQGQTIAIWRLLENLAHNNINSVLLRIENKLDNIIMTQVQLENALNNQTTQIGKIAKEQSDRFDALTETIRLLNEQIAQGGAVTTGVETAQANVQAALDNLDAAIPDAPVVIPPTDPTTV